MKIERKHIGHEVLVKKSFSPSINQAIVLAISPSGKYVKLDYSPQSGGIVWSEIEDYTIEEDLGYRAVKKVSDSFKVTFKIE